MYANPDHAYFPPISKQTITRFGQLTCFDRKSGLQLQVSDKWHFVDRVN